MADGSPAPPLRRANSEVFPIFVDSNLDTRLAMVVSSTDTVADFKRNIGIEHALCFPGVGPIETLSIKVKRRGALYHLSDSMMVRSAFEGIKGTWFLHADIVAATKRKHETAKDVNVLNQSTELQRSEEESLVEPSTRLLTGNGDPMQGLTKDDIFQNNVADVQTELIISKEENLISHPVKEMQPKESECQANGLTTPGAGTNLVDDCMEKGERQDEFGVHSAVVNNLHASTQARKKVFSKKRLKASNHDRKVDENSKHSSSIKEKEDDISKKEDGEKRVPEDAVDHNAEGYSEDSILREDTVKLQSVPVLDSIFEKETDGVGFPEEQSGGAASIKSMPPQFTDKGKKRKLKQSSKPQNEVNVASKKFNRGEKENLGGETEKLEAQTAGPIAGKDVEGKLKKVISKQKHLIKDSNTEFTDATSNMANGRSKKVESNNTRTKKSDESDDIHRCPANNVMPSNASDNNLSFQTTQVNVHIDDLHKVKSKNSDSAACSKEVDLPMISAETGLEGQNNALCAKKRSKRTSSKKSLGESAPISSCELMDEDNTKEATHNKNGYVPKELVVEKIHGEAAISKRSGKVDSDMPSDTNGNDIKEKDHAETEFNHVSPNSFGRTHSLVRKVNKKDKLNDKESSGKGHFGEPVVIGTHGAVVSEAPTNFKKFSQKRKLSVKIGLDNQDFDVQKESPQCQVKEKAERKQKISADMSHKESNSAAKLLAGVMGVSPLKPDLTTDPSTTGTNSCQDKKKLVKSATSPVITKDLDLPSTPGNQASVNNLSRPTHIKSGNNFVRDTSTSTSTSTSISPENEKRDINKDLSNVEANIVKDNGQNTPYKFSTGSFEANNRNELGKSDNDKIDFLDFFSTKPVQHGNVLSATNLASSELESGKEHKDKNKKKKKTNVHSNSHPEFVYPSTTLESQIMEINPKNFDHSNSNLVDPEKGPNGLLVTETESLHDVTVERTSMANMDHIVSSDLLLSSQSPHARMVKDRTQNCISDHDKLIPPARSDQRDKASLQRPEAKSSRTRGTNGFEKSKTKVKQTGKSNGNARTIEIPKDQILSNSAVHASNVEARANQEASTNSAEQQTPIQAKRYRIALRKAPKNSVDKAFKISDEENISFAPFGTTSSDATSGRSEDESDISNRETTRRLESDGSQQSTDSDKDLRDDAGSVTPSFVGKNARTDDGDVILSQASNMSIKNTRIGTIFRSTSSYKKAKLRASQSQAEDLDSQPFDAALESQPGY